MASLTLLSFPTAAALPPVVVMNAASAAKVGAAEEKPGFLDWLNEALDKGGFSETDPILQKVDGPAPPVKPAAGSKKGADSSKKQGSGGFFGLGRK